MTERTMVQALNNAYFLAFEKDDSVVTLGEDVGVDGGVFRVTDGLMKKFGHERVIDTAIAEAAIACDIISSDNNRSFSLTSFSVG